MTDSGPTPDVDAPMGSGGGRITERRLELFATILLAVAALLTTWAGYQASLWDGIQSSKYSQASALRTQGSQRYLESNQLRLADLSVMESYLNAAAQGDMELAEFYRGRARPEFEPAFEAWLAEEPLTNPDAPFSPFQMPEYQLSSQLESEELTSRAEATFAEGEDANTFSDTYTLATLLFASVLFFAAISERFEVLRLRMILLGIGVIGLVSGIVVVFTQPITTG